MPIRNDKWRMQLTYIAVVLCIGFLLFITVSHINRAERDIRQVNVALVKLYRLEGILTDVQAVETGQRGYVITGDETYLFTYNRGLDSIVQNIDLIFPDKTQDSTTEQNKGILLDLIREKVMDSRMLVDTRTRFGFDSARALLNKASGEIMMNRIRVRINTMERQLRSEISASTAKREANVKKIAWEFIISGGIFYLVLFFNYRALSRELKRRRQNEAVLKYNGTLIASVIDPIITTNLDHSITNWNKYAQQLYGWKEEEVIGKNMDELLRVEYEEIDLNQARIHFAENGFWKGEVVHTARDGRKLHILSSISAVKNDKGESISVVGVFTDLTEKKEAQRKLQQLTDNLEVEVQRKAIELNAVFERITDAFIALDKDWNYIYVNPKAAEMHGRRIEELIGFNIWELHPKQVGGEFYAALMEASKTMKPLRRELIFPETGQWFEDLIYPSPDGVSVYYHDITEEKLSELRLQEAHDKLNSHISNTPMAVLEFDRNLNVVQWSKKAIEIFGWNENEVHNTGFSIYDMIYSSDLASITEVVELLFKEGKNEALDIRNITKDDRIIYCEWYFSIIKNQTGTMGIMALVHDITERRKAELALHETESRFRSLVEESMVGVYIIQEGKFTYVNPRLAEIFGYEVDEVQNKKTVLDFVCEYDREKVDFNIRVRMYGIKKSMHYMFDALHKSGKILNVEVYGTFLMYRGDGAVIGTLIDVTERNKYLRMLEASEFELKTLNERFELVSKATKDAIWDWDIKLDRIQGNDTFYQLFGLSDNRSLKFYDFQQRLHHEDVERVQHNQEEALRNKEVFINEEFKFRTTNNEYRTFIDRAYIIYNELGEPHRMLGAMQDVTEQRLAENRVLMEKTLSDSVINSLPGVFFIFNRAGKILRWNKNLELITGYSHNEVSGMNPVFFQPEEDRDSMVSTIQQAFALGEFTKEARLQTKNNEQLDFYLSGMLIHYEGEICLMELGVDLSEKIRAQKQLRESEEKFRLLVEQASDGIFISDHKGRFIMVNTSASMMTGYSTNELLQLKFSDILFREDQTPLKLDEEELKTGIPIIETLMKHKDGHFVYVESSGKHLSGGRFQAIIRDISGRKKAEEAIRVSEYKYRLLFEQNPMPMWMLSLPDKNFLAVNDAAIDFYGYSRKEFEHMNIRDIRPWKEFPPDFEPMHFDGINNSGIRDHKKKSGEYVKVNVLAHDIIYQGQQAKLELANDMTEKLRAEEELKNSHEQLRQLATHLQTVRESERTHMAREIHDELGQQLTGLKMDISWIGKKIPEQEIVLKEKINETIELVDDTVKTVRRLATQLRPSILDDLGLVAAMEWQSEDFQKRSGIETHFNSSINNIEIPDIMATSIFRIYQESLTNVMRHSKASKVGAALSINEGLLILQIIDNGVGYNAIDINGKNTLGLVGMKERTIMMDGTFEIDSKPGKGTTVKIEVPIKNKD